MCGGLAWVGSEFTFIALSLLAAQVSGPVLLAAGVFSDTQESAAIGVHDGGMHS